MVSLPNAFHNLPSNANFPEILAVTASNTLDNWFSRSTSNVLSVSPITEKREPQLQLFDLSQPHGLVSQLESICISASCLTSRSTRTQPLRFGSINNRAAQAAPVSSNVRALLEYHTSILIHRQHCGRSIFRLQFPIQINSGTKSPTNQSIKPSSGLIQVFRQVQDGYSRATEGSL